MYGNTVLTVVSLAMKGNGSENALLFAQRKVRPHTTAVSGSHTTQTTKRGEHCDSVDRSAVTPATSLVTVLMGNPRVMSPCHLPHPVIHHGRRHHNPPMPH